MTTINITQARSRLLSLPRQLSAGGVHAVAVTQRGKPVLAIVPYELYEGILETLEVLADPGQFADPRRSVREMKQGKAVPWERARRTLEP